MSIGKVGIVLIEFLEEQINKDLPTKRKEIKQLLLEFKDLRNIFATIDLPNFEEGRSKRLIRRIVFRYVRLHSNSVYMRKLLRLNLHSRLGTSPFLFYFRLRCLVSCFILASNLGHRTLGTASGTGAEASTTLLLPDGSIPISTIVAPLEKLPIYLQVINVYNEP
eukprot:GHVP01034959.1.p1 GENE.GHVP01034959.1~~GHVP01034959.1.p1  ORF type:complete len:165 (-),score=7.82 GHVP01034959.1:647-1141(-)